MTLKKWIVASADRQAAKQLAAECDIDPFAALIAYSRGYTDPTELEQLISDEPNLYDPTELFDIERAAEFINGYISENKKIAVFGDYDCDGVTATALLYDYLSKKRNADVITYIPDRISEGYGMNKAAIDRLKEEKVELIITVDNGISCAEEIAYAESLGIKTVVTDHHLPPDVLPEAVAVVDPHRKDCPSQFKEICGAEVAFKLVCVLDGKEPEELLPIYADLLCLATLADVMPLTDENRGIVKAGLNIIKNSPRTGIAALIGVAGLDKSTVNAGRILFGLAPRINAAGRMGSADKALALLKSENMLEALSLANEIDAENTRRQTVERQITAEAIAEIEKNGYGYNRVIVVSGEGWNIGVVGIVASRITERYGRPAVVLGTDGETAHGSGRSLMGFSLYDALSACSECLTKFGGHALAGGLSLNTDKIDEFRTRINAYAAKFPFITPELRLDCRINPAGMTVDLAESVKLLEPFGTGNPTPLFGLFAVKLDRITPIGAGKHLKLLFYKGDNAFQALLFGVTPEQFCFKTGDILDLAVTLETNYYKDNYNLSVQIKALRISGADSDEVFKSVAVYNDYRSGLDIEKSLLLPTREEVGKIYKEILSENILCDRIKYLHLNDLGYAKTEIALTVLTELKLIENNNGVLSAVKGAGKTDLMNSETYKKLS